MVTVLLIPGHMCDARLWSGDDDAIPKAFAELGWEVEAVSPNAATITAMAADLLAAFTGPLLPVGFSMGGIVALEMARLAPDRLHALVVLDTNPSADLPERAAVRPRQQGQVLGGGLERVVVEELKPAYLAASNRGNQGLKVLLRDMALALGPATFVRQSEALRHRRDLRPTLPQLSMPTFVACGEEDQLCPPAWHEDMAAALQQAELHVIAGAGHMLPLEQPRELGSRLASWARELSDHEQ